MYDEVRTMRICKLITWKLTREGFNAGWSLGRSGPTMSEKERMCESAWLLIVFLHSSNVFKITPYLIFSSIPGTYLNSGSHWSVQSMSYQKLGLQLIKHTNRAVTDIILVWCGVTGRCQQDYKIIYMQRWWI